MQHSLKIGTASFLELRSEARDVEKGDNTRGRPMIVGIHRPGTVANNVKNTQGAPFHCLKVLCATDLTVRSAQAVRRAALLTQQLDAQMLLLHVVDEMQPASVVRRRAKQALIVLHWRARKLARMDGDHQVSVRIGKPHRTIARVAKEWGADLIVLGGYRGRFADSFAGTTAEHVTRAARRPVLIVKRMPLGPYADVVLATDRPDTFANVARLTRDLGLLDDVNVSVVQALRAPNHAVMYAVGMAEPQMGQYTRCVKQSSADATLAQLQLANPSTARVSAIQRQASPFQTIECVVERTGCDLLVFGAGRFPMLKRVVRGSVSNQAQREITCDVLLVSPAAVRRVHAYERQTTVGRRRTDTALAIEGRTVRACPEKLLRPAPVRAMESSEPTPINPTGRFASSPN